MFGNILKVAFRNFSRHKAQFTINVLGLSVGLACAFLIVLWVQDELSFNRFHEDEHRVYRVMRTAVFGGETSTMDAIPMPLEEVLINEYPEVEHTLIMSWPSRRLIALDETSYRAESRYFGPALFKVLTFPLIAGDKESTLTNPESIVINESLAERFFGEDWRSRDDVLGSVLRLDNDRDVTVTGVFQDVPPNSSYQFEFALPIESYVRENEWTQEWGNNGLRMFVKLREGTNGDEFSAKIKDIVDQHIDRWETDIFVQPMADIYLRSDYENGQVVGGRIEYIRIFIIVAVFIILIASINFMNLATARSAQRAREIGVRKTVGASRTVLARQFLGESIVTALISFIVAIGMVLVLLPSFNSLTDKSVGMALLDLQLLGLFGGIALLTGLVAGSYPALYLSSFNVMGVLHGTGGTGGKGAGLRRGLVVFQFTMSIILIVGTFTVYQQMDYIRNKDLGLDRENVIYLNYEGGIADRFDSFSQEMAKVPGVVSFGSSSTDPLNIGQNTIGVQWEGKDPDDTTLYGILSAGYGLIETLGIEVLDGRTFSRDFATDSTNVVINEMAAKAMGMDDPVGQPITVWGRDGTIVGLVKDFHMRSLYRPIEPVVFRLWPESSSVLYVRISEPQMSEALAGFEEVYQKFNPEYPFEYRFMDESYLENYRSETVIGTLANFFAAVALLIACLGLFGLAAYTAEQRTKEIGIRKVLGASVAGVMGLLSRDFLLLVGIAFVVAAPISYYLMTGWLEEFTFHTEFGIGILVVAGLGAMLIAWMTVSYQSFRAATANPVSALRSE